MEWLKALIEAAQSRQLALRVSLAFVYWTALVLVYPNLRGDGHDLLISVALLAGCFFPAVISEWILDKLGNNFVLPFINRLREHRRKAAARDRLRAIVLTLDDAERLFLRSFIDQGLRNSHGFALWRFFKPAHGSDESAANAYHVALDALRDRGLIEGAYRGQDSENSMYEVIVPLFDLLMSEPNLVGSTRPPRSIARV